MRKITFIKFVLALAGVFIYPNASQSHPVNIDINNSKKPKTIIVFHSYENSNQWSDTLQMGIEQANQALETPFNIYVEHIDASRFPSQKQHIRYQNFIDAKYEGIEVDAIVIADDYAFQVLESKTNQTVDIPIIAVSIVDKSISQAQYANNVHITYDNFDMIRSVQTIGSLRPDMKTIYYVGDRSVVSDITSQEFISVFKQTYPQLDIVSLRDLTVEDLAEFLSEIHPNDAVILGGFISDIGAYNFTNISHAAAVIANASAAPVFTFWEHMVKGGVVGGHVLSAESHGVRAITELATYFEIEFAREAPVYACSFKLFDYFALNRNNISLQQLPRSSVVINKPVFLYKENMPVILSGILITLSLLCLLAFWLLVRRNRRVRTQAKAEFTKQLVESQRDLIYFLGEVIESRSGETGFHVKRVAKMSAKLAELKGLSNEQIRLLEIVSPLHDVGKIIIPEAILEKPGKLTSEEFEIVKSHTIVGYNMLSSGHSDYMEIAAIIANEHHEKWDGTGYPNSKSGEDIHILARITAVADVFDALMNKRVYKEAWPIFKVMALFEEEAGKQFDPELVRLFLDNFDEFVRLQRSFSDHHVETQATTEHERVLPLYG